MDSIKACRDTIRQTCVLQLVGYADQVVHSGASRVRNIDTLFFMLLWDRYRLQKKCDGTRYTELLLFCIRRDLGVM
jgi:hypothetical protein